MRTTKPISTISFNTPDYLRLKLEELRKAGRISFWAFITHQPEDDEGGRKEHNHVYIEPSKMLQTDDLKEQLKEYDPQSPTKPRGCISFVGSRFDPWYMYALHDKRYLASKGQARKFHYLHENIETSDHDDLLYKSRIIDMISLSPYADMEEAIKNGVTWTQYFSRGTVPLPQVALFERAWNLLVANRTHRAGKSGHEMDVEEIATEGRGSHASDALIDSIRQDGERRKAKQEREQAEMDAISIAIENGSFDRQEVQQEGAPSWYDLHPQADFVSLDPDEELPW